MTLRSLRTWPPHAAEARTHFDASERLRIPAAVLDAICLSVLLWLTVLAILR